nr:MAG TPA: hypothetical protein [Caudoviricetes sp.]
MLKHLINKMYNIQEESETIKVYRLEGFVVELNSDDIICRLSPKNEIETGNISEFYDTDDYRRPASPRCGQVTCDLDEQIIANKGEEFRSDNKYFLTERSARLYLVKQEFLRKIEKIREEIYRVQLTAPKSGFVLYSDSLIGWGNEFNPKFIERTKTAITKLDEDGINYQVCVTTFNGKVEMNVTTALRKLYTFKADVNELFAQFKEDEKALYSLEIQKRFDYIALIELFESLDK